MKYIIIMLLLLTGSIFYIKSGYCVWCPSYTCFSRCSSDCACMTIGGGGGSCVGISSVPDFEKLGFVELR